jgi:hypothetical protein
MQITEDSHVVTEDEMNLIESLRRSVGGPYIASLSQEQKEAFIKFMSTLHSINGGNNSIH